MHAGKNYRLGQALNWTKKQIFIFTIIAFTPTFWRTIEIDLREMLDETEIPEPIKPIADILM